MNSQDLIFAIKTNNLEKLLFNLDYIVEECNSLNLDFTSEEECYQYLASLGLVSFESVDWVCNSDEMYCVIHFKSDNIYLKIIGEYDSYGANNHWYNKQIEQVFPKQITKTIYE